MKIRKNVAGVSFGWLTAIRPEGKDKYGKTLWICSCACGKEVAVNINSLTTGNTKSCGCRRSLAFVELAAKKKASAFGKYHVRARTSWHHMIDRCTNERNKHFADYGGRGIRVCEAWMSLRQFVADMGDPPEGMTLDRWPDKNGNYEPGNCRWATPKQQAQNTRRNVMVVCEGETLCASEVADRIGIKRSTLYSRIAASKREVEDRIGIAKPA